MKRAFYSLAAMTMMAVLVTLGLLVLGSCSAEPHQGQTDGGHEPGASTGVRGQAHRAHETSEDGQPASMASLVPIVHLTSFKEDVSRQELSEANALAVPQEYQGLAQNLLNRSSFESFDSPGAVVDHVSRNPGAMGLVPWDQVGPSVKVFTVDGKSLLDPDTADPRDYPLATEGTTAPDPGQLRRMVVGGDIVLDRGQNYMDIQRGMGVDFSLDGGYAAVTSRTPIPSQYSEYGVIHEFTAERRGGTGKMREYLHSADLTLANFENPVIRNAVWHPDAPTFTGDLRLMPILQQAGIDGVTLGNNHILDAGTSGIAETMKHLDDAGIEHAGAGMDLAEARKPMIFDLGGTNIGVLSYQGVPSYEWAWAKEASPGTAPLEAQVMREDIKRLRPKVDLVVVMPHWGQEYLATPERWQVKFAHAAVDAGADLIIGDHAHWAKGIEVYKGKSIFYGTGNFLFDQSWSEETSTGIFEEITLYGDHVLQSRPIPYIVVDKAQPNFLLPKGGGNRALRNVFSVSPGPEFKAYKSSH